MKKLEQEILHFFRQSSISTKKTQRILVACSGGPDSVSLALALKELSHTLPHQFVLAHINHGLRGNSSKQDEAFVKGWAKKLDWPYGRKKVVLNKMQSGNLEEKARVKRYDALTQLAKKFNAHLVLTAHNQDDQIETMLMNMGRGSGPEGLSGMVSVRAMGKNLKLGRPLLNISKKEILIYLKQNKTRYRNDATNQDTAFLRNWMRRSLLPLWESRVPSLKSRLSALSQIMQEEQGYWNHETNQVSNRVLIPWKGGRLLDLKTFSRYPLALQRRVLRKTVGKDLLTFDASERLRSWMMSPPTGRRTFQLRKGWIVERLSRSKGFPSSKQFWFHQNSKRKLI